MASARNEPEAAPASAAPTAPPAPTPATPAVPPVPAVAPVEVEPLPRGPGSRLAALLVCALLGLYGYLGLPTDRGLAYDEAMHAALPAQRASLALRAGRPADAADALLDCDRYPPVYPALLAAVQVFTGPSDTAMRRTTRLVWALALFGVFLLASETARRRAPRRGKELAPWVALALAATSPLAVAYSGTLFLEVPFACAMAFALHAWLRRDGTARAEHRAGALVALAFFTKFNYGVLLALVLLVDLSIEGLRARDRGRGRAFLVRSLHLAALPVLSLLLWFVLLRGAQHRRAFVDFLTGNTDPGMAVGAALRWIDWSTHFAYSPLVLLLIALGLLADLVPSVAIARAPARVARLAALVFVPALALHPFHLDRFLLPAGVGLWVAGGLGLARLAPENRPSRLALVLLMSGLVYVSAPALDLLAVQLAGKWPDDPDGRTYVTEQLRARRSLSPRRRLPVAALFTVERDALLDRIAAEVGPGERVAWLGIPTELSRGVLHAGLLARAAPADRATALDRFLKEAQVPLLLETEQSDPQLAPEAVLAWADGYDAILFTQPIDLKDRPGRRFVQRYLELLRAHADWDARRLGGVHVRTSGDPFGPGVDVALFVLRRIE